jgi:hypothetical protein
VTVQQQSIGDATSSFGFPGLDGILGVGPPDLTNNTVTGVGIFSTFMGNLQSQRVISRNILGIFFQPESGNVCHLSNYCCRALTYFQITYDKETAAVNGLLTFGGVDMTNCPGPITYTPRSRVSPYSKFWGIDIESTSYGSTVLSAGSNAIVDTVRSFSPVFQLIIVLYYHFTKGTTLILIADQDFQIFLSLTGGSFDANIGIPSFEMRPTLVFTFKINGVEFPLTPDQYLIPDAELADLGMNNIVGPSNAVCTINYILAFNPRFISGHLGLDLNLGTFAGRWYTCYNGVLVLAKLCGLATAWDLIHH